MRVTVMTKETDTGKNNNKKDGRKFKIRYLNACCQQDNPFKNENIDELKIKNKSGK